MLIKKIISFAAAVVTAASCSVFPDAFRMPLESEAVSKDYAPQLINISLYDDSANLTAENTADKSAVTAESEDNALNEQWRIDYCGANSIGSYYKIINAASGRLLTPTGYSVTEGSEAVIFGNENDHSQYWYIQPVDTDSHGYNLGYKILNYSDNTMALTYDNSMVKLSTYSGAGSQKWLLNSADLQGFAGYCFNDNEGKIKAGNIGGLLGETVEASTFDELKNYASSDIPYTIVITSDIKVTNLTQDSSGRYYCPDGRIYIHSNKTIIGSYGAHTLYNVQFCTSTSRGTGNNVILKNMELQHDSESNGNDSIVVYFGSGKNLWVDHCTFIGHSDYNTASTGLVDNDKFLACCYDADYCTVSDCSFGLHEYGLILGYPADDDNSYNTYNNYPRMSLFGNKFDNTLTRAPGLMRYGYFHSMNNYVNNFSMAYTVHTASKIFAENCYYENGGNVICDWNSTSYPGSYAETGSKSSGCKRTQIEGYAQDCTWRPNTNYNYRAVTADAAKAYCNTSTGAQNNAGKMTYALHQSSGVPSAGFMVAPEDSWNIKTISAFETIEAESFDSQEGVIVEDLSSGGQNIGFIENGDYIMFRNVDFSDGARSFKAVLSGGESAIEFYLDSPDGDMAASVNFEGTTGFSDYREFEYNIPKISGTHNLYIRFTGKEGYLLNVDSFTFGRESIPLNGELIKNLIVFDEENSADWSISSGAADGSLLFGDRSMTYVDLPEALVGAEYIRTACDSKNYSDTLARFTAAEDMTVYVALDQRVETVPEWLSTWEKTGMTAANDSDVAFDIYSRSAAAGEEIVLGTNGQSAYCVNYTVFARAGKYKVKGDVNSDGELSAGDVVMMQKWLLGAGEMTDWTAGDICEDGRIDVFDLCLMKRALIYGF